MKITEKELIEASKRSKCGEQIKVIAESYNVCSEHLSRLFRSYNLDYKPSSFDRFFLKVNLIPLHRCWEWSGAIGNHGYGVFDGELAHRYSYNHYIGDIPKEIHVLHECDNRSCVNPKHLFLGTNDDNIKDKLKKGRQAKWENAGSSKLGNSEVIEIKERLNKGETHENIAKCFNVHPTTITCINTNKTWKEFQ